MKTSEKGKDLIKLLEGYSEQPYKDVAGIITVGWGHTGKDVPKISSLSKNVQFFENDIEKFERLVNSRLNVDVSQSLYDALVSHVYNTGKLSTTIYEYVNSGKPIDELSDYWVKHYITAQGSRKPILQGRRMKEVRFFNPNYKFKQ